MTTSGPDAHAAGAFMPVDFGLLTVSDSRTASDDLSGRAMRQLVEQAGHRVHATAIVRDEPRAVAEQILHWAEDPSCEVVVASGGTGVSARDRTADTVSELFDVSLPGFGELFRMLSFQEIGAAAMLSRAVAGVVRGTPVFALPGSPKAVTLAMTRLVLPEIGHLLRELRRQGPRA